MALSSTFSFVIIVAPEEVSVVVEEEPFFKTIKLDNGQLERIIKTKYNPEYGVVFPAVFIRFINIRYLVQQQRIGEGRATMRIRFVLNDLNNSDDDVETNGFKMFQIINNAIQDGKDTYSALTERCNLTYFDIPESMNNGLQPFWIDYEVWFRTSSSFQYRNWVEKYIVMPPYTNHSDAPAHDVDKHGDHKVDYDSVSKIIKSDAEALPSESDNNVTKVDTSDSSNS